MYLVKGEGRREGIYASEEEQIFNGKSGRFCEDVIGEKKTSERYGLQFSGDRTTESVRLKREPL